MLAVTVQAMSAPGKPTFPRQRAVKATSLMNKSTPPQPTHAVWVEGMRKQLATSSTLFAGFAAAAHVSFFLAAPALADISNLNPPAPVVMDTTTNADDTFFSNKNNNPAIDALASLDASDVLTEIEDAEIPQLEVKMGQLAAAAASNPSSSEAVAAAERQLEAIEREAALIAEAQSSSSYANGSDSSSTSVSTGGLLNELSALKTVMRGIPTK